MIESIDCAIILGQRGCGKSYLAKNFQRLWPRRVILDSLNEYTGDFVVHNFNDFADTLLEFHNEGRTEFVLIYQFNFESKISGPEFDEIIRLCYYFGNIQIVIEEIQLYSTPHNLPWRLENALLTGRHQNLALLFTSQRPALVHKTIISQCRHIFVGRVTEGNDARYLASIYSDHADKFRNLADRRFLYFNNGEVKEISNEF